MAETWDVVPVSQPTVREIDSIRLERRSDPTEPERTFCLDEKKENLLTFYKVTKVYKEKFPERAHGTSISVSCTQFTKKTPTFIEYFLCARYTFSIITFVFFMSSIELDLYLIRAFANASLQQIISPHYCIHYL